MRVAAVVPTYRNLRTLPTVCAQLVEAGFPVIVVDDGSTDGTGAWATAWSGEDSGRWLIRMPVNRGKGAALAAGLAAARELGFDCAVSVDSDGQHLVEDAVRVRARAREGTLVVGARDDSVDGYPLRSRLGRRIWALGVRALTGLGISDPICGLRAYPLAVVARISCEGGRFTWEEEFLVRAVWAGVPIEEVAIATVYLPVGERVSHFSAWDWFHSFGVFSRLAVLRIALRAPRTPATAGRSSRDRSWRWMLGAACVVGGIAGACAPWWIAGPALAWVAWRLHASVLLCCCAVGAATAAVELAAPIAGAASAALVALAAVLLAVVTTRAARFLGSS